MKFISRISAKIFSKSVSCTQEAANLYELIRDDIYCTGPGSMGYPGDGQMSNYYPDLPNITKEEIGGVEAFLESKRMYSENTRIKKICEKTGVVYELLIVFRKISTEGEFDITAPDSVVDGTKLKITYGDYSTSALEHTKTKWGFHQFR